jgi:hypothetical protein
MAMVMVMDFCGGVDAGGGGAGGWSDGLLPAIINTIDPNGIRNPIAIESIRMDRTNPKPDRIDPNG